MYSRILYIVVFSSFVADNQLHRTPMGTGRDKVNANRSNLHILCDPNTLHMAVNA